MKRTFRFSIRTGLIALLMLCLAGLLAAGASASSISTSAIREVCNRYGFRTGAYWTYDYSKVDKTQTALDSAATSGYKASGVPYGSGKYRSKYYTNSDTYYGEYIFRGGRQCYGFVNFIGYQLTGSVPTSAWTKYSSVEEVERAGGLQVGDVIRSSGHSAMVLTVSGSNITTVECWGGSKNKISVGGYFNGSARTLKDIKSRYGFTAVYRYGGSKPDFASDDKNPPAISASGEKYPSEGAVLQPGKGFGLRGVYTATHGKITRVDASVKAQNGSVCFSFTATPNAVRYDVNGTPGSNGKNLNNTFVFGQLKNGTYTMTVTIQAENAGQKTTKTVTRTFSVGSAQASSSGSGTASGGSSGSSAPAPATVKITIQKAFNGPDTIRKGNGFGLRGIAVADGGRITQVTSTVRNADGKTVMSFSAAPGSSTFDVTKTKGSNGKDLNNTMIFNNLGKGTYTYSVTITAEKDGATDTYKYSKQFRVE